jgi:RNA polymerase sigma-70 factor, ECF subfamily
MNEREAPDSEAPVLDAEQLFRRHAPWVARYVTRLGYRGQDVEDIVQDTFLVAHRRGGFREGAARPTTWLAEIAFRVGMATRRARQRAPVADGTSVDGAESGGADPFVGAMHGEALANVQRALETLDLDRRALFVLFELEGETCDALAAVFDIPVGTVYSRLHHARRGFLAAYQKLTKEPARGAKARAQ